MQKSGKLYHKMQSKSIQCPADSDEEHSAAYADDEEAPLPTSVKLGEHEHGEENQMVITLQQLTACIVGHGRFFTLRLQTN
jgi:hypothetical protein